MFLYIFLKKNIPKFMSKFHSIIFILMVFVLSTNVKGQITFEAAISPDILFDFNTIQKYTTGITYMNAMTLNITSSERFDLYVGAITTNTGLWDATSTYSTGGDPPHISILQLQFRNISSTSLVSGFFPLTDILNPTYIIGTNTKPDIEHTCDAPGTNIPGDYMSTPTCYKFYVDLKLIPGFTYQSGLYKLVVDYVIITDL